MSISYEINSIDVEIKKDCPVCKTRNIKKISDVSLDKGNYNLPFFETSFCEACQHIYRSKRPDEKWFFKKFEERRIYQTKNNFNPINQKVEDHRYQRYGELMKFLKNNFNKLIKDDGIVYDFGCGTGTGMKAIEEYGLRAIGVEPDLTRAIYGINKGLQIITSPWSDINKELKNASFVFSIHSLEHFYNPEEFINHVNKNTNDDCYLYLEVPNSSYENDWTDSFYLSHLNNFSKCSIIKMLNNNGYYLYSLLNPQEIYSNYQNSICAIFTKRKNENLIVHLNETVTTDNYKPRNFNLEPPYHFLVDCINDLSLTYRVNESVSTTVKENQKGRSLKLLNNFLKLS